MEDTRLDLAPLVASFEGCLRTSPGTAVHDALHTCNSVGRDGTEVVSPRMPGHRARRRRECAFDDAWLERRPDADRLRVPPLFYYSIIIFALQQRLCCFSIISARRSRVHQIDALGTGHGQDVVLEVGVPL